MKVRRTGKVELVDDKAIPKKNIKNEDVIKKLVEFMNSLEIGEHVEYKNLRLFPVFRPSVDTIHGSSLMTLDEAMEMEVIDVIETKDVNMLEFENKSRSYSIILFQGQVVKGGAQNRVINTTMILEAGTKVKVPVCCVQHGRWDNPEGSLFKETIVATPNVSNFLAKSVYSNLKGTKSDHGTNYLCAYAADQSGVWDTVDNDLGLLSVSSSSQDMSSIYKSKEKDIDKFYDTIKEHFPFDAEDLCGIIALVGDKIYADICCDKSFIEPRVEKLIKSYITAALQDDTPVDEGCDVEKLTEQFNSFNLQKVDIFDGPQGYGKDVKLNMKDKLFSAFVTEVVIRVTYGSV